MAKKLSIIPRAHDRTGWQKSSQFSPSDIQEIRVSKARNDRSLNAIPSPLARMHLFEAAFDLLDKDEINGTDYTGDTFKKLVSDCFDVFELIYNWNNHLKDGKELSIVKWNKESEISQLLAGDHRHKLLGSTLNIFLQESAFENCDDILIIKYKNQPIAGSSPFTGFFTAPGEVQSIKLYNQINRSNYFSRIIPFESRRPEIRKFIHDFFEETQLRDSTAANAIRVYLRRHAENNDHTRLQLENIKLSNNERVELFGKLLQSNGSKTAVHYFEKYLIKINYRLNDECFYNPLKNGAEDREYDYLLPLTLTFFEEFKPEEISKLVSITEKDNNTVDVIIRIGNESISKRYQNSNVVEDQDGKIIELAEFYSIKINMGIYPFLKINTSTTEVNYNDFYKVAFMMQDDSNNKSNNDFNLNFGKNGRILENGDVFKLEREERTIEAEYTNVGSTYYTLNTIFDFVQIEISDIDSSVLRNSIVPKWREKLLGKDILDYSIDFGTTTTFIAYTDDPNHQRSPSPFCIDNNDIQVAMLNKPLKKREDFTWENAFVKTPKEFLESTEIQKHEFLPSILLDGKYKFPIRTALFQKRSIADNQRRLFANANIAFTYQREQNRIPHLDQQYLPDLKWNIETNDGYRQATEIFLQEIFYLIRIKTLLNNGDPRKTTITWFSPLSLTPSAKKAYVDIWERLYSNVFKSSEVTHIQNLTESEAPYYFLNKKAAINNSSSVLTLDIGGGSTDIMLFKNNVPVAGTSVNFGANVLWGNGFNEFKGDKSNGIFKAIKDKVSENLNIPDLVDYNEEIIEEYGSDEIINFWLLNDAESHVTEELQNKDFKLSYLLHLTALIYHSVNFLKIQKFDPPTCIIFSGNGSKYIDLIQSSAYIEKICGYISRSIYNDHDIKNPQVVLPKANRKEATCYGGLYRPKTNSSYKALNYLGFETNLDEFKKYADIDAKKDTVFEEAIASFKTFIDVFFQMNENEEMSFRSHFGINEKLRPIKDMLKEKASENLMLGYDRRREKVDSQDTISDSLFFYPLIGLIFKLNNLTESDIQEFIGKTTLYALGPDNENEFLVGRLSLHKKADSIFVIVVPDDSQQGELNIIDSPSVHRKALGLITAYLSPVCDWDNTPRQSHQEIKVVQPGKVELKGDKWIVKERLKIRFI